TTNYAVINTKLHTAIRSGQRPPVDVAYNTGISAAGATARRLTVPLDPSIVKNLDALNLLVAKPSRSSAGNWDWVGIYSYTIPILYRSDEVSPKQLDSWLNLFDPKWKRNIEACDWVYCWLPQMAKIMKLDLAKDDLSPLWKKMSTLRPNIALIGSDADSVKAL